MSAFLEVGKLLSTCKIPQGASQFLAGKAVVKV
jgi:hypothetical protein